MVLESVEKATFRFKTCSVTGKYATLKYKRVNFYYNCEKHRRKIDEWRKKVVNCSYLLHYKKTDVKDQFIVLYP
jgi:hypothetical protein